MVDIVLWLLVAALLAAVVVLAVIVQRLKTKYAAVLDVEAEAARVRTKLDRELDELKRTIDRSKVILDRLNKQYGEGRALYDRLQAEILVLEESLDDISFGLYRPHYDFEDPERFKAEIAKIYELKKRLIKGGLAVNCPTNWTVNGSNKEGKKMIKQESKLMLRAFNGEVDAAVAKVGWSNAIKMEERIKKTFEAVNELGSVMQISVSREYFELALAELRLTHELEVKKQEAKDEQRQIREQMREEELAQREFERAKKAAEAEEARYERALKEARAELEKARAGEMELVSGTIAALETKLAEAQAKLQRAVSMAQLTRSGHVYVISNIGSFGDDVFKIGMTRRLDPTERVYELGSASVPFPYDIHAMIYAVDAPALENAFHKQFAQRRVNLVNTRKEFFRVTLAELEVFASTHDAQIQFTKLAEAREYRETLAFSVKSQENALSQKCSQAALPYSLTESNISGN